MDKKNNFLGKYISLAVALICIFAALNYNVFATTTEDTLQNIASSQTGDINNNKNKPISNQLCSINKTVELSAKTKDDMADKIAPLIILVLLILGIVAIIIFFRKQK